MFDATKNKQQFLTRIDLKYRQAKSVFLKMNCQFKVVSVKLQSAVVFQWVKEVWKIMQINSSQVERFLTRKYVPTFFQSEKTRYLSPNFIKKIAI